MNGVGVMTRLLPAKCTLKCPPEIVGKKHDRDHGARDPRVPIQDLRRLGAPYVPRFLALARMCVSFWLHLPSRTVYNKRVSGYKKIAAV